MSFITCAFCNTEYPDYQAECRNCGGPLPARPGKKLSERPPPPPRKLPPSFLKKRIIANVGFMVGAIFALVGTIFGVVFPIVGFTSQIYLFIFIGGGIGLVFGGLGFTLAIKAVKRIRGSMRAYEEGSVTEGKIKNVFIDYSLKVNGRSPWAIEYEYSVHNMHFNGKARTFDSSAEQRKPGQPVYVLYLPKEPMYNTIYPPLN